MKSRKWVEILLVLIITATLVGCASSTPIKSFRSSDVNDLVTSGRYVQRVETFIVLLDASESMGDGYPYTTKLELARDFLGSMNRTIPNLPLKGGLDAFGTGDCLGSVKDVMVYGMTDYTPDGFASGIEKVKCVGGNTPLAYAIGAAGEKLADATGNMAMIIVSDARHNNIDPEPGKAAEALKEQYGDRLCIYTVMIGEAPHGEAVLRKISDAGKCGFFEKAGNLSDEAAMADFVKKVFLQEALDSDGDGVYDQFDECPDTPKGVSVDAKGCPYPVPASAPAPVTPEKWVLDGAWFDFDKSNIKPEWIPNLADALKFLNAQPNRKLEIQGHTDNYGSPDYNQKLSVRRATAAKNYLVEKGISADRIIVTGFGEKAPVAPNDTKENRAKNRRVELIPR